MFSTYDQANFSSLLCGHGDWFHAELARLIAHADSNNREALRQGFPEEVAFFEQYAYGAPQDTPAARLARQSYNAAPWNQEV